MQTKLCRKLFQSGNSAPKTGLFLRRLLFICPIPIGVVLCNDFFHCTFEDDVYRLPGNPQSVCDICGRISKHQVIQYLILSRRKFALGNQPLLIHVCAYDWFAGKEDAVCRKDAGVSLGRVIRRIEMRPLLDLLCDNPFFGQREIIPLAQTSALVSGFEFYRSHYSTTAVITLGSPVALVFARFFFAGCSEASVSI